MKIADRFEARVKTVPVTMTQDGLWRLAAYRQSLFLSDLAWEDATVLLKDRRTVAVADQLVRAVGSIGANVAEGYGKGSGKDRARFYEYSLGSARESRDWYYKARYVLGEATALERLTFIEGIIRLLLVMIPDQRGYSVHEEQVEYNVAEFDASL